jgi:hypothetical protein
MILPVHSFTLFSNRHGRAASVPDEHGGTHGGLHSAAATSEARRAEDSTGPPRTGAGDAQRAPLGRRRRARRDARRAPPGCHRRARSGEGARRAHRDRPRARIWEARHRARIETAAEPASGKRHRGLCGDDAAERASGKATARRRAWRHAREEEVFI